MAQSARERGRQNMTDITIELAGKTETLRCSLAAAKAVNAHGGFMNVLGRLGAMDQDFYVLVVSAGLDKKFVEVEKAVYDAGLPNLTEPLCDFVQRLTNGGKPLGPAES
jgi:hypothetical protein